MVEIEFSSLDLIILINFHLELLKTKTVLQFFRCPAEIDANMVSIQRAKTTCHIEIKNYDIQDGRTFTEQKGRVVDESRNTITILSFR